MFKKHILTYATAAIAMMATSACNDISENDRLIALPSIDSERVVLVEEYTGQNCVNCPAAHDVLNELIDKYPDNIIAVCFHGGGLAYSEDQLPMIGLGNAEADAYYNESKVAGPPAAVINRSTAPIGQFEWGGKINDLLQVPTHVEISDFAATLADDGKSISTTLTLVPSDNYDARLQLWVIENGIQSMQITPTGPMMEYVHNHVFRASVNGHDGQPVTLTRQPQTLTHSVEVRDDNKTRWNVSNLEIVAFVYDKTGVIQAAITPVISE